MYYVSGLYHFSIHNNSLCFCAESRSQIPLLRGYPVPENDFASASGPGLLITLPPFLAHIPYLKRIESSRIEFPMFLHRPAGSIQAILAPLLV
jgi:hypothetical protein